VAVKVLSATLIRYVIPVFVDLLYLNRMLSSAALHFGDAMNSPEQSDMKKWQQTQAQ
jgi:hypothetical protein